MDYPRKIPTAPYYLLFNEDHIPNNKPDDIYVFTFDGEKSLVVILTLKLSTSNYLHRIATLMPLPDQKDLDLYNRLKNIHTTKGKIKVEYIGIARGE